MAAALARPPSRPWHGASTAFLAFYVALITGAGAGVVFHAVGMVVEGPFWVYPAALDLWLAALNLVLAVEGWRLLVREPTGGGRKGVACTCVFAVNVATVVAAVLLALACFLGFRVDGALWATALSVNAGIVTMLTAHHPVTGSPRNTLYLEMPEAANSALCESERGVGSALAALTERRGNGRCAGPCKWVFGMAHGMFSLVWVLVRLCTVLLLGGAWLQAVGWHKYPPRGSFYTLSYPKGQQQRVHALCTGLRNTSRPTFWIEVGGGGHSMSDLWGVQEALQRRGWRVCSYDVPGTAWSDYAVPHQPQVTEALMTAMGEPGPFIMLGHSDDGPARIYKYALEHPDNVVALVPVQYGPPEFLTVAAYHNWSASSTRKYAAAQLASRFQQANIIRGLAVQWGLMPLFAPPPTDFAPASLGGEHRFLNLYNEKQWTTQALVLSTQWRDLEGTVLQPDIWTANRSLAPSVPVLAFYNEVNLSQECEDSGYPLDSAECRQLQYSVQQTRQFMINMTTMTRGSQFLTCPNTCGFNQLDQTQNVEPFVDSLLGAVESVLSVG